MQERNIARALAETLIDELEYHNCIREFLWPETNISPVERLVGFLLILCVVDRAS